MNNKFVQICGPFQANKEIDLGGTVEHIGIYSIPSHICYINGQIFEIGKTQFLELNDVEINSIYFQQYESESTIIDCILE